MDRKSIIVLVVSFALILLWSQLIPRLYPPKPLPAATNAVAGTTNVLATATNATTTPAGSLTNVPAATWVVSGAREELLVVENAEARYTFTSHGGALKLIELKHYPESVACGRNKKSDTNDLASLNTAARLPVLALLGGDAVQGDGVFKLVRTTPTGVRAKQSLSNGLYVVKEFQLGTNYLVSAFVRLENRSTQPLTLPAQQWVLGTATPIGPQDDATRMGLFWFNGVKAEHIDQGWFANRTLGCIPGTPRTEFVGGLNNVNWAAVHNQFFALAILMATNTPASQVSAVKIDLPAPSPDELRANPKTIKNPFGFQAGLRYPSITLAAGESWARQFYIYGGPKEYNTLARLGAQFKNEIDLVMDYGGFFGFFAKVLLLSMNGLYSLGLPYGLAIITITIIIKTLFWPLTQASTRSMKRMQALQPQMKAIQEKFKDDPVKMNRKVMEFMKEHKVSPLGGCLPMVLQIPVFFGFYRMIQSAIELRGARFLWACDLSKPDTLFIIPGFNFPFNPLPLLMGATMLWQARLTPPSPGMDPMQQKIMKYMPLMFLFILYNFSAGLTLYWTVQNLLTIAQMKLTRAKDDTQGPAAKTLALVPPAKKKRR